MAKEAKEAQGAQGAKEAEGTIRCQLSAVSYQLSVNKIEHLPIDFNRIPLTEYP